MKKISLTFLLTLFSVFAIYAQTNDSAEQKLALTELGNLNGQVIALFKQKDYDAALKASLNAWSVAEKNGLAKDSRVLPGLSNLAEIYLAKGKESEAIATFQKILDAYQADSGSAGLPVAKIYERIGTIYFVQKDFGKAEEFFLKALPLREKLNGAASREAAVMSDALGDTYRAKNDYEKAREFYLKAIEINDKILTADEKETRADVSNYECFLYHKAFAEGKVGEVAKQLKDFKASRNIPDPDERFIDSGIINGKAINLMKPNYPMNMRGSDGFALVRVTIDEQGKVISAKATCGISGFVEAVELAARKSKFAPTLINGQPVKVTGVIVYNFVRR